VALLEAKGYQTLGSCGLNEFRSKRQKDIVYPGQDSKSGSGKQVFRFSRAQQDSAAVGIRSFAGAQSSRPPRP
jgi:hypothetical protein